MKKLKNILKTLCLALVICLTAVSFAACGKKTTPEEPDPTPETPGQEQQTPTPNFWDEDVAAGKAIAIGTYEELKAFITEFRSKEYLRQFPADEEKYVVITDNIDCNGEVLQPFLTVDYKGVGFKIEGADHTISNFKLDHSCLIQSATMSGSSTGSFNVLGLFPVVEGGTIQNLNFDKVNIEATLTAEEANNVDIGIVGYARSNGSNDLDGEQNVIGDATCSTFKNIKISNMTVKITAEGKSSTGKYPLSIGALIGIDSDSTNTGDLLNASTTHAVRENIKVTNFNVEVTKGEGAIYVGGVVGQLHWMKGIYKNCEVDGTFKVTSTGENTGIYAGDTNDAFGGDTVNLGGLIGGHNKGNTDVIVEGGKANVNFEVNAKVELVNAGNVIGLLLKKADTSLVSTDIKDTFIGECTLKVNSADAENVTTNVNEK